MKWRSLGRVFETKTYGQTPTPLVLEDRIRVYFAARDEKGQSFIRFADLELDDPTKIIGLSGRVLPQAGLGTFDQHGQMPSYAFGAGRHAMLYYSGWNALKDGYHNAMGVCISEDFGQKFYRTHHGPIMDRTKDHPYLAVTPWVVGNRMWYINGLRWELVAGRVEPIYVIAEARYNGLEWVRYGRTIIPQAHDLECFSRPTVHRDDKLHLWYSYRSARDYRDGLNAYRIGYATSTDGGDWLRQDDSFRMERSDWDATMQAYPAVFEAKGKLYMLFNGNSFGAFGFGVAVCEG